jgi:hypothetical protein
MDYQERIKFYLGEQFTQEKFEVNKKMLNKNMLTPKKHDEGFNENYIYPLKLLIHKTHHSEKELASILGDVSGYTSPEELCKNRMAGCTDGVILRCLNFNRHWSLFYNKPNDIPFNQKKSIVLWRGTTTGDPYRIGNRFDLVKRWFNKNKYIDVGFSSICQNKDEYKQYVKGMCDVNYFLQYKYIISVEGNDKDSGLNWKLNSNSLVLMPKPLVTSWLMETTLIPNHHYVLLNGDFSDLEEKLIWCTNNQSKCKEIIKNANLYMSQFKDYKKEQELELCVINKYFSTIGKK